MRTADEFRRGRIFCARHERRCEERAHDIISRSAKACIITSSTFGEGRVLQVDHARDVACFRRTGDARKECESRVFSERACSALFCTAHGDDRRKRGFAHESRNRLGSGSAFETRGDSIAAPFDESCTEYARTRGAFNGQWDFFRGFNGNRNAE
jgi:hypothetical protein